MDWQGLKDLVLWIFSESHVGRVARLDYLKQRLMLIAAGLALAGGGLLLTAAGSILILTLYILVGIPVWFVLFYRGITLDIQRLHDIGLSGWWLLAIFVLALVPFIGGLAGVAAFCVFLFVPGTTGANGFGAEPGDVSFDLKVGKATAKPFARMVEAQKVVQKKPAKPMKKAKAVKKRGGR